MKTVLLSLLFVVQILQAKNLSTQEKLADFAQINLVVDSSYGPLYYKQKTQGLNLEALREDYRNQIISTKTNSEFYYTLVRYVSEFHDGHFGAVLPSDYKAEIPISTDLVEGKVLVGDIDRKKLSEKDFPYLKGDEIISLNGEPVEQVVQTLSQFLGGGFSLSEKRLAAMSLFFRSGRRFPVPTGDVVVEVRRGTSDLIEKVKLTWTVSGTPFDEKISLQNFNKPVSNSKTNFNRLSIQDHLLDLFGPIRLEKSFQCSGSTRIEIPQDATIVIRTPFLAYYHPTAKGNVGYLRIPHYFFDKPEQVFKQYEYAVKILEENTVGLIIDQDHNCGGSVDFLHSILSLFISEPVKPMQFELLASKKEYFQFKSWISEIVPDSIDMKSFEKVLDLIKTTWEKGDFLTTKTAIGGDELVFPNRYRYTKPIVMLIDELSGSGGDAFPALMGGYKRATLLGTRTWGLGGHVEEMPPLNFSGLNVRMTKSLFYRPDGVAVENNGAVPDVAYSMTRDDYMYQYKKYQKFYLKVLLEQIK